MRELLYSLLVALERVCTAGKRKRLAKAYEKESIAIVQKSFSNERKNK